MTSSSDLPPQSPGQGPAHLGTNPVAPDPESTPHPAVPAVAPAPAAWAWASQPQPMQIVETEPLEYHRLYLGVQGFKWWKSLVILGLAVAFFLLLSLVLGFVFAPILMAVDPEYMDGIVQGTGEVLDTQHPVSVLLSLLSIILMIPALLLAMTIMGVRPTSRAWSVALRIRWGLLGRATLFALLGVVAMNAVGIAFEAAYEFYFPSTSVAEAVTEQTGHAPFDPSAALLSLLFIVLLVPLQSTAEELAFRGVFMQVLGSWLKTRTLVIAVVVVVLGWAVFTWLGSSLGTDSATGLPVWTGNGFETLQAQAPVVLLIGSIAFVVAYILKKATGSPLVVIALPTLLFALGHIYDIWGLLAVSTMGLFAAWLTWRTGGLEAAIAIHIINNLAAFGLMTAGFGGSTAQTESAGGPLSLVGEVVGLGLFAWLVVRSFKKHGYGRARIDLVRVPVAPGSQVIEAPQQQEQPRD